MPKYLYHEIADEIERAINNKEYGVHQKLPSENELATQFNTTRLTIRNAIDELEHRQVVVRDRNRGTFVLAPATKISSGSNGLVGFTEAAKLRHLKAETIVLNLESVCEVASEVRKQLNLKSDETVWKIERLRLIDGQPMTHEQIFLQKRFAPNLDETKAQGSLFEIIEQYCAIAYASQELEAVILDGKIGELLQAKNQSPAFLAHTTSYSVEGYPILYDESYYRADRYTFHNILYRNH